MSGDTCDKPNNAIFILIDVTPPKTNMVMGKLPFLIGYADASSFMVGYFPLSCQIFPEFSMFFSMSTSNGICLISEAINNTCVFFLRVALHESIVILDSLDIPKKDLLRDLNHGWWPLSQR